MNAAKDSQYLPIARKFAADLNAVLSDAELLTEISAANGSMRKVMSRVKRLSHEFDTKRANCLISLETVQKFPLQQAQLRIRHGLSDIHRRQQVSLLAVDIGDA